MRLLGVACCLAVAAGASRALPATPGGRAVARRGPRKAALPALTERKAVTQVRAGGSSSGGALAKRAEVGFLFAVWYALNVWYNIENKKTLKAMGLPWSVSAFQLLVGSLYAAAAWAARLRECPTGLLDAIRQTLPIALTHGGGQACTVISLGAGKVSSTHVVKALEPLFSAVVSAVAFQKFFAPAVYAALVLVVSGVGVAVAKDVSFSPRSFGAAMASNALFACRAVFSKRSMGSTSLSAPNLFAVVTMGATLLLTPVALLFEAAQLPRAYDLCLANPKVALSLVLSGLFHYLNNEVMYMTLSRVDPVTLAVGNTVKRVVIIAASLVAFREPMSPTSAAGASVALAGTLLYSLLLSSNK